jgi:hypothetical protein
MRYSYAALTVVLVALSGQGAEPIDTALAAQYFREAQALWKEDGGKVWGVSLESPLIFAERKSRRVIANQADAEGKLKAERGVFVGELPEEVGIANYSLTWAGVKWTMVMWPLPKDKADRAVLMMHESWHRVQAKLGFPMTGPRNEHLDRFDGRLWLQLEWRALAAALRQPRDKRAAAIEDALALRAHRRSLFKTAAEEERLLEVHEGLAEYTGVRLAGLSDAERDAYVVKQLTTRPGTMPNFVRSFAYLAGPAYGVLLDAAAPEWRKKLTKDDDLGVLLAAALKLKPVADDLDRRASRYDVEPLSVAERKRDDEIKQRVARWRTALVDGPRLTIPLVKMQMSFDPNAVQPIEGVGTVYPTIRLTDEWGTLTVTGGALINSNFKEAYVVAPTDAKARPLKEPAWELRLNDGWTLEPGPRRGDFRVVRAAK